MTSRCRAARQRDDVEVQWGSAIRLAHANGASLRDIAAVAGAPHRPSPTTEIMKEIVGRSLGL